MSRQLRSPQVYLNNYRTKIEKFSLERKRIYLDTLTIPINQETFKILQNIAKYDNIGADEVIPIARAIHYEQEQRQEEIARAQRELFGMTDGIYIRQLKDIALFIIVMVITFAVFFGLFAMIIRTSV